MDAASGGAAVWWWVAIAALFLVVIPLVLYLAQGLLSHTVEIKKYSDDVLVHGLAITANLEPVPALLETRTLVKEVGGGLVSYAGLVDQLL